MYIAIDFDGTIVSNKWPEIGEVAPFAIETIKRFKADGHKIILNTCRENELLQKAIAFLAEHEIFADYVNDNPVACENWGKCRKVWADMFIDDHNAFIPKLSDGTVNWLWILRQYENAGSADVVKRPSHYQGRDGMQAIDVIENFGLNYNIGNAEKYILRAGRKDGNSKAQDLKKAIFYIEREIQRNEMMKWPTQ